VYNANPESKISWADLLIEYGRGSRPAVVVRSRCCLVTTPATSGTFCSSTVRNSTA
jgi:hypothetical protein